jgi:hypothetical protein
MRHLFLLLAVCVAAAGCPGTSPCEDADSGGVCPIDDCNDADADGQPSCTDDCDDADGDGASTCDPVPDCDDTDALVNPLDADGDGASTCDPVPDCDDTDALVNRLDADNDGVSTCDAVPDCDDASAARSPNLAEVCGDGIDNNCSGRDDALDADDDGDSTVACGGTDCDDLDPRVSGEGVEDCTDGLDNDCSGLADDADVEACDCPDPDNDGYRCDDVDDVSPYCGGIRTDTDLDGVCVDFDVDDRNPECGLTDIDVDEDGYCVDLDVDDNDPNCFTTGIDEDDDGFCVETDTNDRDASCTTDEECCTSTDTTTDEVGQCSDAIDNDCDGLTDSLDPDCEGSACDAGIALAPMQVRASATLVSGDVATCDAGPAPGICETDITTAMAWLSVPVVDPDALGWSLELCASDATAVVHQEQACSDGRCLPRSLGCYSLSGTGTRTETFGVGSAGSICEIAYTLALTVDDAE